MLCHQCTLHAHNTPLGGLTYLGCKVEEDSEARVGFELLIGGEKALRQGQEIEGVRVV